MDKNDINLDATFLNVGEHPKLRKIPAREVVEEGKPKSKHDVLRELNEQLAVRAERMKLLARAEEGLVMESISANSQEKNEENLVEIDNSSRKDSRKEKMPSQIPKPTGNSRERRRKKLEKKTGKLPQKSLRVLQYRPGYTWNRGGRLKEIKIRHIARKYLWIWKRKAFGRILPSEARHHYKMRVQREAFSVWYDIWWKVRKEWRLTVRAECHYRYTVSRKALSMWKIFIHHQRITKAKICQAQKHCQQVTLRKAFHMWQERIAQQKKQKALELEVAAKHSKYVLRLAWTAWLEQFDIRQERKNKENTALQFWAHRIQAQHWILWCQKLASRMHQKNRWKMAVNHENFVLQRKTLAAWLEFWNQRKAWKRKKAEAAAVYTHHVKYKMMLTWVLQYNKHQVIKARKDAIHDLARRFQARRLMEHWKHYAVVRQQMKAKEDRAVQHYFRHLMSLVFSCFKLNVLQAKVKVMRCQKADAHYSVALVRCHWAVWKRKHEDIEEREILPLSQKAWHHYDELLLNKYWQMLCIYVAWRKHRKTLITRADAYFYCQEVPRIFDRLRKNVVLAKRKREQEKDAEVFRRENVTARFFYMWHQNFEQAKEDRLNLRMAVLHDEEITRKRFWSLWKYRYDIKLEDKENETFAAEHYRKELARKCLHRWRCFITEIKEGHTKEIMATQHFHEKLLSKVWNAIKTYAKEKKLSCQRSAKGKCFYHRKLCQKAWQGWTSYVIKGREVREVVERRHAVYCRKTLRWALSTWKQNVEAQIRDHLLEQTSDLAYNRCILAKVFQRWHRYAVINAYKKSEKKQWIDTARAALDQSKMQQYFSEWKRAKEMSVVQKLHHEQAVIHRERFVMQHVLDVWRNYTHHLQRKKLLHQQSQWFHCTRLTVRCFTQWKLAHQDSQTAKQKSVIALWHWSLVLQRKMLVWWMVAVQERKRKKQRVLDALARRHAHLLRSGLTKWLEVTCDIADMRAKFSAQSQAQEAFTKHQLVQKCALHWRYWAAKRKRDHVDSHQLPRNHVIHSSKSVLPKQDLFYLKPQDVGVHRECRALVVAKQSDVPLPIVSSSPVKIREMQKRKKPRHPSFLVDSLKRAGLFDQLNDCMGTHVSAVPTGSEVTTADPDTMPTDQEKVAERLLSVESSPVLKEASRLCSDQPNRQKSALVHGNEDLCIQLDMGDNPDKRVILTQDPHTTSPRTVSVPHAKSVSRLLTPADFMGSCEPESVMHDWSEASTPRTVDTECDVGSLRLIKALDRESQCRHDNLPVDQQIIQIRNKLKQFEIKKKKLRRLQKQHHVLTDWVKIVHNSEDVNEDIVSVKTEIQDMQTEIRTLQTEIEAEKPLCAGLVVQVKKLVEQLKSSSAL